MEINLRWFNQNDIQYKVKWINDSCINEFLHYDLPLCENRTKNWYMSILNKQNRSDFVYEVIEGNRTTAIGLIGLLNISIKNKKAEFYIVNGNKDYWGKGLAYKASVKYLKDSFLKYDLNKIYLYTEMDNLPAQKLFKKLGFEEEGLLRQDLYQNGKYIDRYIYGLFREDFLNGEK